MRPGWTRDRDGTDEALDGPAAGRGIGAAALIPGLWGPALGAPRLWAQTPQPMPTYADAHRLREDAALRAVAFADANNGIACGERGTILRTRDGGQTWQSSESGVDCRLDDIVWVHGQRAVIVGGAYDRITGISRGVVLYSEDAGQHWQRADDRELPRLRSIRVDDTQSLVAWGDWSHTLLTRRLVSHDGGRSWHDGSGPNRIGHGRAR